jgi:general secretion pathway protein F/type IV pilus assembly protein PilC
LEVEIGEGKGFSEALSSQKWLNLPPYLLHSVQVGESSGKLDLILLQTAQFLEEEERISSQSTQALIYPTFIISVSLILVIVMMGSVVPKIVKIFQDLHQKLPPITQFTISVSHFFQNHGVAVGIAILGTIFGVGVLYKKFLPFRRRIDGLLLKIPVINRLIISKNLGRFSYLTHTLTSAGVNFVNALNLASKTIDNRILAELFHDALEEVLEGKKISTALKKRNFPDLPFVESLGLVEETGEASSILESLSRLYLDEYRNRTTLLLSLLEPVMILIVGGIIGFIVISMLLPIFQMNVLGGEG